MSENREKAKAAVSRPASFGPDLDLSDYSREASTPEPCSVLRLPREVFDQALRVGVDINAKERAGTYFQMDHSAIFQDVRDTYEGRVEILNTPDAFKRYDWLNDYWWKTVPVDADKYTAIAELGCGNLVSPALTVESRRPSIQHRLCPEASVYVHL